MYISSQGNQSQISGGFKLISKFRPSKSPRKAISNSRENGN